MFLFSTIFKLLSKRKANAMTDRQIGRLHTSARDNNQAKTRSTQTQTSREPDVQTNIHTCNRIEIQAERKTHTVDTDSNNQAHIRDLYINEG